MPRPTKPLLPDRDGNLTRPDPTDWRYWGPFLGLVALVGLAVQPLVYGVGWAWGSLIRHWEGKS
jgi:hypothetical protein